MFASMQKGNSKEKRFNNLILISGLATFSYLIILSQIYFKERTCFADMSFILFNIIKDQSLAIQVNRFGSAITQIFPLAGVWFGLSLETIMRLYSSSFIIWYFSVFLICYFVFQKQKHALLMLLFAILMVTDTFYWITNEQLQGIAFCILMFSYIEWQIEKLNSSFLFYPILILGIFTAAFFHPLVVVGFCFFCIYNWLNDKRKIWLVSIGIFSCFYFVKLFFFTEDNYDQNAFSLLKIIPAKAKYFFVLTPTKNFIQYLFIHYYFWLISIITCCVYYIKLKKWNHLLLINFFTWFYLFVINTSFADNNLKFYMESHYLMLGFFISFPLCFEVFPSINRTAILICVFIIGIFIRCIDITTNHKFFTSRITYLENLQSQTNNLRDKKLLIHDSQIKIDTLLLTWGTAYENWLISSLKNPNNQRSILIDYDLESIKWALPENKSFITRWGIFPYKDLPIKYFLLNDTSNYVFFDSKLNP